MTPIAEMHIATWVWFAILIVVITVLATVYSFWNKRNIDPKGPRKGVAANPEKVRRQNPPTDEQ